MHQINKRIEDDLHEYNGNEHFISVGEMKKAIGMISDKKSDGEGKLSNLVIHAPDSFTVHLSLMATSMMVHGYNPQNIWVGTLISLPKNIHADICDSDNYHGICLCSCLTKIIEWVILIRHSDKLMTSWLQFAFRSGHSTSMSTLVVKEVVTYYWNRQSNVYSVFIDASKDFDRVRYDILFQVLYDRGLPPILTRLIIDMYIRQQSRTVWEGQYSHYCNSVNGVRQGGVASPVMFTVYMDELIMELKRSGIGCHIGHKYYSSLGYADDLKLLCPSIKSLQKMVNICAQFGKRFDVQYNAKKTFCVAFSRAVDLSNGLNMEMPTLGANVFTYSLLLSFL